MKAIILAAGYATRMYPLTENTPKALLPIRGKPILNYIVEQLSQLPELNELILVSNDKFYPAFLEWAKAAPTKLPVAVLNDGTTSNENRRGAVGDVFFAIKEKNINEEIIVLASDNYFTYPLREQYELYRKTGCDTLAGKEFDDREQIKSFAVAVLSPEGKVLDLEEKPAEPKSNMAIYATYFFRKETTALFEKYLSEGNSPDNIGAFPQWLYKFRDIYAYKMNGECYDIGTLEMYEAMK
ncbi:MAG: nucleotidyltransferase family protein [Defluviitaleaceae bacterium]|nr:nucleotidyltransferase family protein [Defluviitaleaceae bacterium]